MKFDFKPNLKTWLVKKMEKMFRKGPFCPIFNYIPKKGRPILANTLCLKQKRKLIVMSSSWIFPARAKPSYEGSEPSQARALQFLRWNQADNTNNMYAKK